MNKSIATLAVLGAVALALISGCTTTGQTGRSNKASTRPPAASKKPVSAVCPVMGTKIPDVTNAAGKSVYKGKTYYFCCPGCKPQFDKNPAKYVK